MKNKTAYNNKRVFRKTKISQEDYDNLTSEAAIAQEFLEDEKYQFIRELLTNAKDYAQEAIVENRIMDVQEVTSLTEKMTRIFSNPKEVQIDELSGQYKLVNKFFSDLQEIIDLKADIDYQIAEDRMIIDE